MDTQGFPLRLDIFKAMIEKLAQEEGWGSLGPTWLRGYLNWHPELPACFAPTMVRQRVFANALGPIKDCFRELRDAVIRYKNKKKNMWNMDQHGFTLGTANHAKVIACAGRHLLMMVRANSLLWSNVIEQDWKYWFRWLSSRVLPTIVAGIQWLLRIHLATLPTV